MTRRDRDTVAGKRHRNWRYDHAQQCWVRHDPKRRWTRDGSGKRPPRANWLERLLAFFKRAVLARRRNR